MSAQLLWAPRAWVDGGWRLDVLLRIDAAGRWAQISPDTPPPPDAQHLPGTALPGLVDAHSHAFQRAFAGLAERREGEHDDFWSWRDQMYAVALRIGPAQLRAVAAQLYAELLTGGYTHVCEFHYLHHAPDGSRYPDPLAMSRALAEAAADTGIGLTLLPVLYERAGFDAPRLRDDQRRFTTTANDVLAMHAAISRWQLPRVQAGVAIHSLRAAAPASIAQLVSGMESRDGPIHVHVAEQTGEVDACLAATGQRPIDWLHSHVAPDPRWHLVHATHAQPQEIAAVARSGAGIVLCPTTEANLGDGLTDVPTWLAHDVTMSVGSDSHICRTWPQELRLLEYGQRLTLRQRNIAAAPARGQPSTAARLFEPCIHGGASAAGFDIWGLRTGARADLLVLDARAPGLLGVAGEHQLDTLVFATDAPAFAEVWVAGKRVVRLGRHEDREAIADRFAAAVHALDE